MSRNRRLRGSVLLAAALVSTPGLAAEVTNVLASDRYPVPAVRESKYRNRIATELGQRIALAKQKQAELERRAIGLP